MRAHALLAVLWSLFAWAQPATERGCTPEPGRQLSARFLEGKLEPLWANAAPQFRRQFGSLEGFEGFAQKVKHDFGVELRLSAERVQQRGALCVYVRLSAFSLFARGVELQWTFDANGLVAGVSARPAATEAPSPHEGTTARTVLRLPIEGAWNVLWGGQSWEDNRHASVSDQRYALDLLIWRGQGSFEGAGTRNEHYLCWGRPALAPAAGLVVIAEDGAADNVPGVANPQRLFGNHLVIDHRNGEYSLLAHLQRGSLAVGVGDAVRAGQLVGKVGNSGQSTEAHLHYQLMDSPRWIEAHGLRPVFVDFFADGKPVARGELRRWQQVAPRPPGP